MPAGGGLTKTQPGHLGSVSRAPQGRVQLLLLAVPPRVFGLDALLYGGPFRLESFRPSFVLSLRFVQGRLRLCDQLVAPGAFLFPRRLFLAPLGFASPLLALEFGGSLAGGLLAHLRCMMLLGCGPAFLANAGGPAAVEVGWQVCVLGEGPLDSA